MQNMKMRWRGDAYVQTGEYATEKWHTDKGGGQ